MDIVIQEVKPWSAFVKFLLGWNDFINFCCETDHIYISTFDRSNGALLHVSIPSTYFASYKVPVPKMLGIGVENFSKLTNICAQNKSPITMKFSDKNTLLLSNLGFGNDRAFEYPLTQIEQSDLGIPEQVWKTSATLRYDTFLETLMQLKELQEFGNEIDMEFRPKEGTCTFCLAHDAITSRIRLKATYSPSEVAPFTMRFSLSYFFSFSSVPAESIVIDVEEADRPVKLSLPFQGITCTCYIAPLI